MMKRFVGAAAALALITAPTLAAARSMPTTSSVAPASDSVSGEQLRGRTWSPLLIILLLDLAAIIAALLDNHDGPPTPHSP